MNVLKTLFILFVTVCVIHAKFDGEKANKEVSLHDKKLKESDISKQNDPSLETSLEAEDPNTSNKNTELEIRSMPDKESETTRKKKSAITTFCVEIRPSSPDQKPFKVCDASDPNQPYYQQNTYNDQKMQPSAVYQQPSKPAQAYSAPVKTFSTTPQSPSYSSAMPAQAPKTLNTHVPYSNHYRSKDDDSENAEDQKNANAMRANEDMLEEDEEMESRSAYPSSYDGSNYASVYGTGLPYKPTLPQHTHNGLVITCQPNLAGYAHSASASSGYSHPITSTTGQYRSATGGMIGRKYGYNNQQYGHQPYPSYQPRPVYSSYSPSSYPTAYKPQATYSYAPVKAMTYTPHTSYVSPQPYKQPVSYVSPPTYSQSSTTYGQKPAETYSQTSANSKPTYKPVVTIPAQPSSSQTYSMPANTKPSSTYHQPTATSYPKSLPSYKEPASAPSKYQQQNHDMSGQPTNEEKTDIYTPSSSYPESAQSFNIRPTQSSYTPPSSSVQNYEQPSAPSYQPPKPLEYRPSYEKPSTTYQHSEPMISNYDQPATTATYTQPAAPASTYSQPAAPAPSYSQQALPAPTYPQPAPPAPTYSAPAAPVSSYSQPSAATSTYSSSGAPISTYSQPAAPAPAYSPSVAPSPTYSQSAAPSPAYMQPAAPAPSYSQPLIQGHPQSIAPTPTESQYPEVPMSTSSMSNYPVPSYPISPPNYSAPPHVPAPTYTPPGTYREASDMESENNRNDEKTIKKIKDINEQRASGTGWSTELSDKGSKTTMDMRSTDDATGDKKTATDGNWGKVEDSHDTVSDSARADNWSKVEDKMEKSDKKQLDNSIDI